VEQETAQVGANLGLQRQDQTPPLVGFLLNPKADVLLGEQHVARFNRVEQLLVLHRGGRFHEDGVWAEPHRSMMETASAGIEDWPHGRPSIHAHRGPCPESHEFQARGDKDADVAEGLDRAGEGHRNPQSGVGAWSEIEAELSQITGLDTTSGEQALDDRRQFTLPTWILERDSVGLPEDAATATSAGGNGEGDFGLVDQVISASPDRMCRFLRDGSKPRCAS
jgi:hypothetical protein